MKTDRRLKFREGLYLPYVVLYDALCSELSQDWQPYCGLRTFEEQTELYSIGRTNNPKLSYVTYADAGQSPHNYGCASDWTVWTDAGVPVWLDKRDAKWKEYEQACDKIGLKWGGNFSMHDMAHNELPLKCRWKDVGVEYNEKGKSMAAAKEFILKNKL